MLRKSNVKIFFSSLFIFALLFTSFGIEIQTDGDEVVEPPKKNRLYFAAWNIKRLGQKKRGPEQFKAIAHILNKYDFIAITELMKYDVIKPEDVEADGKIKLVKDADLGKIIDRLSKDYGRKFKYLISPQVGWKGSRYQEHYAFLYDEALVCVVPEGADGNKNGSLYHEPIDKPGTGMEDAEARRERRKVKDKFIRPPFWATFRAGNFDFSVVVVHTQPKHAYLENKLMDEVYSHVQEKNGPDEDDVLLVGDFNLYPGSSALNDLPKRVTSLFQRPLATNIRGDRLYDNIFLDEKHLQEYLYSAIDEFDEIEFDNNDHEADHISDHRPVWAVFSINLEDDD